MKRILFVLTNVGTMGDLDKETGFHLPEVAHPYSILKDDFEIEFASIKGGFAHAVGLEDLEKDSVSRAFYLHHKDLFEKTKQLNTLNYTSYDAIFFPGGHGTMWDLPLNKDVSKAIIDIYENKGVIASVCHGPVALVDVTLSNGDFLLKDKKITCFSNDEEESIKYGDTVPFLLETALLNNGAKYEKSDLWQEKVVVDSNIITGQNPASAFTVGAKIKELLDKSN